MTVEWPTQLSNENKKDWCAAEWRNTKEWGGNLHLCCYPKDHAGWGHCYKLVEFKPCNHLECSELKGGTYFVNTPDLGISEETLSLLLFQQYHHRQRQQARLQFPGWEIILNPDGTYDVEDTSGG